MYSVTSIGTLTWLGAISLLALLLVALIIRKCYQHARDRKGDTVFVPPSSVPTTGMRRPIPLPPKSPPPAYRLA